MDPRYKMADYEYLLRDAEQYGTVCEVHTALNNLIAYCAKIARKKTKRRHA